MRDRQFGRPRRKRRGRVIKVKLVRVDEVGEAVPELMGAKPPAGTRANRAYRDSQAPAKAKLYKETRSAVPNVWK